MNADTSLLDKQRKGDGFFNEREMLRVARDQMRRAHEDFERSMAKVGAMLVGWVAEIDDPCFCGRQVTLGVQDFGSVLKSLAFQVEQIYDLAEARWKDTNKRGTKRIAGAGVHVREGTKIVDGTTCSVVRIIRDDDEMGQFELDSEVTPSTEVLPKIRRPSIEKES